MPEELEPIWQCMRDELRRRTPDLTYHLWLEPLELAAVRDGTAYVRAPEHIRTWVEERHLRLLRAAAAAALGPAATAEVVGADWRAESAAAGAATTSTPAAALNPKYTFDQFVIGDGNRFAHAAALAVAELPAQAYSPLFIHGRPGLGKTHLLHAIGHYVERFGSGLRVRYATVEEFTTLFVDAIRSNRTTAFKEAFRGADVLLIDDVQFLASKERTREEFFHTINALHGSGRQLVLTSDRGPDELAGLEDRLAERFRAGLVVGLEPPDLPVRRVILGKRARLDGVAVDPAVLDVIAERVTSSVRALEGALIQVVAYASLRDEPPTPELAARLLGRLGGGPSRRDCTVSDVIAAAARTFDLRSEDLVARDRRPRVSTARQVAMYVARELTGESLPEIGRSFGGRNHTTVLHAIRRVGGGLDSDRELSAAVDKLRAALPQSA